MLADGDWEEQDVMFDYYLRMAPFLTARSAAVLRPLNSSSTGFWQVETATVFGSYAQVRWNDAI